MLIIAAPDRRRAWRRSARRGRRHAFGDHFDHGADRGAALADAVEILLEERGLVLVGQKNGLRAISSQSHLSRSILCGPICTSAPRTFTSGRIFARDGAGGDARAVSRADERPPPR
jgi:hypothetical protein